MAVPLPVRKAWVEQNLLDEQDRPIEVRPWIIEHVWKPLDGFKSWPREARQLCPSCAGRAGRIFPRRDLCASAPHGECAGLEGHKVILVAVDLTRQEGKTTAAAAYELAELRLALNSSATFMAAAEGQADSIFEEKFEAPVRKNPALDAKLVIGAQEIVNIERGNRLRYIPTSKRSSPGRSTRLLIIDEARDVDAEVAMKLMPAVLSMKGLECAHGHYTGPASGPGHVSECPTCRGALDEVHGRVLVMSSAGEDSAWFTEMVEHLRAHPDPGAHLFSSDARLNAHKSSEAVGVIERVFGAVPSMAGMVQRELHNVVSRRGDEFVPPERVDAMVNKKLRNLDGSDAKCVAFLDCSRTTELTSLVILGDVPQEKRPVFSSAATLRIDVFDPADKRQFPGGRIDYSAIRAHLDAVVPAFSGLLELHIDVTKLNEAQDLYAWARKRPWGSRVREYHGNALEQQLMWDALEARVLAEGALEIIDHERLKKELKKARVKITANGVAKVMDSEKGDRRGPGRVHRDVSMSLAGCCWVAAKYFARASATPGLMQKLNQSLEANARFKPVTSDVGKKAF